MSEKAKARLSIREGDWVDAYGGYGIVVKVEPEYYEYWYSDIPEGKKVGDKKQDIVLVKILCNHEFKVRPQVRTVAMSLMSPITKKDMAAISKLLKDEKVAKKFENYRVQETGYVINWDQDLPDESFEAVRHGLENLTNNGNLAMTMKEIEKYFREVFDIDLFRKTKSPNCYVQLLSSEPISYRCKEMLFKEIRILRSPRRAG